MRSMKRRVPSWWAQLAGLLIMAAAAPGCASLESRRDTTVSPAVLCNDPTLDRRALTCRNEPPSRERHTVASREP
jgi:hypothetical protein